MSPKCFHLRKMRYRNVTVRLKIAIIFFVSVSLFSMWYIFQNNYWNEFRVNVRKLYAKINSPAYQIRQNGNFWILENYIVAREQFGFIEWITYTTHGEYAFLDNVEELVRRWQGPISIAVFAPGLDFSRTIRSINYLRRCSNERHLIQELVTFHIYFPVDMMPTLISKTQDEFSKFNIHCSESPPFLSEVNESYRRNQSIPYPINVGRNIARRLARTHFIFPSDIEMYPSSNFIGDFMNLIHRKPEMLLNERQVYPLAVFEVDKDQHVPETKTELQKMLITAKAIPFHMKICISCHAIPKLDRWIAESETENLDIFLVTKHQARWEPFYVTTNSEPFFDERYTWEGRYDKQIQADLLSLLNYDFVILNNAFLVHRPGIKTSSNTDSSAIERTNIQTLEEVKPQHKILFG